jgi:hypothetical protein
MTAGSAEAARRIRAAAPRLTARAVEVALDREPAIRERRGEAGLRKYLHDAGVFLERIALSVAADDPLVTRQFADQVTPMYRRRRVPIDDLINLHEGFRVALPAVLAPEERPLAERAIDAAIESFRWNRRIAGDARRRNPILDAIYKGA